MMTIFAFAIVLTSVGLSSSQASAELPCDHVEWAAVLSDGHTIGKMEAMKEAIGPTGYAAVDVRRADGTLVSLFVEDPTMLSGIRSDLQHVFFFVVMNDGLSSSPFLIERPRVAIVPAKRIDHRICLDRNALVPFLERRFQRSKCSVVDGIIERLQTKDYQDAIDVISSLPKSVDTAICLADATDHESRLFASDFVDPFSGERYYAPVSTVGELIDLLIPEMFGIKNPSVGARPPGHGTKRRLFWRSFIEAYPREFLGPTHTREPLNKSPDLWSD